MERLRTIIVFGTIVSFKVSICGHIKTEFRLNKKTYINEGIMTMNEAEQWAKDIIYDRL